MAPRAMRQECQLCGDRDEFVTWDVEGPSLWRYTCTGPDHGPDGYSWLSTGRSILDGAGHDGICEELGIYDDLLRCFQPGEPYIEFGVVEYRYAVANPIPYKHLVHLYSHTGFEKPGGIGFSTSALIGKALGKLRDEGLLVMTPCRATGFWKYNGMLNAWALPPRPEAADIVTWKAFATEAGLGPDHWPQHLLT